MEPNNNEQVTNNPVPENNPPVLDQTVSTNQAGDKAKKMLIAGIILILLILITLVFVFLRRSGFLGSSNTTVNINESFYGEESTTPTPTQTTVNQTDNINIITRPATEVVAPARLSLPVPEQSAVMSEANIPAGAIKIVGTPNGFEPAEFTVNRNENITLALTAKTERPVVLTFYDPNMAAVSIGCGPGETRWVTIKTPAKAGEYMFRNDTIGLNGQTGKMIVK